MATNHYYFSFGRQAGAACENSLLSSSAVSRIYFFVTSSFCWGEMGQLIPALAFNNNHYMFARNNCRYSVTKIQPAIECSCTKSVAAKWTPQGRRIRKH